MTSAKFQGVLLVSVIALSAGLKTESMMEMRNDIMTEHTAAAHTLHANLESKSIPKSFGSKVKENFDALEVAIALQMATQQRLAGFVQGSLLFIILAALGLYAINNQSGKKGQKACAVDADFKKSSARVANQVQCKQGCNEESALVCNEESTLEYNEESALEESALDCDEESAFLNSQLNQILDDSLEAEAEAFFVQNSPQEEETTLPSRTDLEVRKAIEQELDEYLDRQHASEDLDADLSVLRTELNKMLDDSLEAEAQAGMVIHKTEEEVDVSRIEMEIAEQFSEALGFSQIPAWME